MSTAELQVTSSEKASGLDNIADIRSNSNRSTMSESPMTGVGKAASFTCHSTVSPSYHIQYGQISDCIGLPHSMGRWEGRSGMTSRLPPQSPFPWRPPPYKDTRSEAFSCLRASIDWWMSACQGACLSWQTNSEEPLDLSVKSSSLKTSVKFNGCPSPSSSASTMTSAVEAMKMGICSWKSLAACPIGFSDTDYQKIWRDLCRYSFRTTACDASAQELIGSSSLLRRHHPYHHASSRPNQSRNEEKPIDPEFIALSTHKTGRIRRLTNYLSAATSKPASLPTQNIGTTTASTGSIEEIADTKLSRRPYTEAELAAAVRAICFDRLGTRRAASVYGIPRSTLRNKICKLNELKKREEERLGGKSIVMADFLQSLMRSQPGDLEESGCLTWTGRSRPIGSIKDGPGLVSGVRGTVGDRERLFTTATHVASIFQVNCRKSYGVRNLNAMRYALRSTASSRLRGGRIARLCVDRKQMEFRRLSKSETDQAFCMNNDSVTRVLTEKLHTSEVACTNRSKLSNIGSQQPTYRHNLASSTSNPFLQNKIGFTPSASSAFDPVPNLSKEYQNPKVENKMISESAHQTGPDLT